MTNQKECPKCGGKELRTEVSTNDISSLAVRVVSYQCRECGTWFF